MVVEASENAGTRFVTTYLKLHPEIFNSPKISDYWCVYESVESDIQKSQNIDSGFKCLGSLLHHTNLFQFFSDEKQAKERVKRVCEFLCEKMEQSESKLMANYAVWCCSVQRIGGGYVGPFVGRLLEGIDKAIHSKFESSSIQLEGLLAYQRWIEMYPGQMKKMMDKWILNAFKFLSSSIPKLREAGQGVLTKGMQLWLETMNELKGLIKIEGKEESVIGSLGVSVGFIGNRLINHATLGDAMKIVEKGFNTRNVNARYAAMNAWMRPFIYYFSESEIFNKKIDMIMAPVIDSMKNDTNLKLREMAFRLWRSIIFSLQNNVKSTVDSWLTPVLDIGEAGRIIETLAMIVTEKNYAASSTKNLLMREITNEDLNVVVDIKFLNSIIGGVCELIKKELKNKDLMKNEIIEWESSGNKIIPSNLNSSWTLILKSIQKLTREGFGSIPEYHKMFSKVVNFLYEIYVTVNVEIPNGWKCQEEYKFYLFCHLLEPTLLAFGKNTFSIKSEKFLGMKITPLNFLICGLLKTNANNLNKDWEFDLIDTFQLLINTMKYGSEMLECLNSLLTLMESSDLFDENSLIRNEKLKIELWLKLAFELRLYIEETRMVCEDLLVNEGECHSSILKVLSLPFNQSTLLTDEHLNGWEQLFLTFYNVVRNQKKDYLSWLDFLFNDPSIIEK
ncbi:hypothetical protein O9G_005696 [Rozella allomycis CSF55]|uniref:Telomere-associated protein Rif1 N-terminal domain-containing protein n=1 Tax=Rozella allomycis (strain CSF55) TaxID=988480 RepID=A0A075B024_ROZAC|nr:hypothetical protein O9G_005696 [Rozella allomycis CSF55]|eukprot:EPZ34307.1 hypothetical protein O9G_005696 [Rozella allomycis CSF55]